MRDAPIGIFDSGVGGLTDARELVADIEVFMSACDGAEPIGLRGTVGHTAASAAPSGGHTRR